MPLIWKAFNLDNIAFVNWTVSRLYSNLDLTMALYTCTLSSNYPPRAKSKERVSSRSPLFVSGGIRMRISVFTLVKIPPCSSWGRNLKLALVHRLHTNVGCPNRPMIRTQSACNLLCIEMVSWISTAPTHLNSVSLWTIPRRYSVFNLILIFLFSKRLHTSNR